MSQTMAAKYRAYWLNHNPYDNQTLKICPTCGQQLERTKFCTNPNTKDGLGIDCKSCANVENKVRRGGYVKYWAERDPYANELPKQCPGCRQEKVRTLFNADSTKKDGLSRLCSKCSSQSSRNQRRRNPLHTMVNAARARSKKDGTPFTITPNDIHMPIFCPVFSWMRLEIGNREHHEASPTLDRIDNTLGYIPGNVRIISYRANRLKSNATIEEIKMLLMDAEQIASSK